MKIKMQFCIHLRFRNDEMCILCTVELVLQFRLMSVSHVSFKSILIFLQTG